MFLYFNAIYNGKINKLCINIDKILYFEPIYGDSEKTLITMQNKREFVIAENHKQVGDRIIRTKIMIYAGKIIDASGHTFPVYPKK